jgi:hypothetical protein
MPLSHTAQHPPVGPLLGCLALLFAVGLLAGCTTRQPPDDDDNDDSAAGDDDSAAGDDDSATGDDDISGDDDSSPADPWLATASMYAHTAADLYEIDDEPPYGHTLVSTFHRLDGEDPPSITDIAVSLDGQMYGASTYAVWHIAPGSGAMEMLFEAPDEFFVALTFLADGSLLVGGDNNLYLVDLGNGSYGLEASFADWSWDGDMVGLPDGYLYCIMRGSSGTESSLVIYDAVFDNVLSSAPTGVGSMFGVAYGGGILFGFTDGGEIVTIDAATGVATQVATTGLSFWGAATNPVLWSRN